MRSLASRVVRGAKSRIRRLIIRIADFILPRLPGRAVLAIVRLAQSLNLPGQNTLLLYLITASSAQKGSSNSFWPFRARKPVTVSHALEGFGGHQNALEVLLSLDPKARTPAMNLLVARTLFELGEFERARTTLTDSGGPEAFDFHGPTAHFRGLLELCAGNAGDAEMALRAATTDMPNLMAPHQNLAAKNPSEYQPTQLDVIAGQDGRLFDAYNYLGQRVTHVGMGQLSTGFYAKALEAQKRLQERTLPISARCASYLAELGISPSDVKVFASEWQTQIGHEGMLDVQLRMRELGWWKGDPVVLVNSDRVANLAFLSLFARRAKLLSVGRSVPSDIARELISLQRYCGLSFNAFEMPDGTVVQWSEAAALALRQWDQEGRQPPLRAEFDRKFSASPPLVSTLAQARHDWGMKPDDWYVCLHLRDGSFYGEARGAGQSHRNTNVENYRAAIEYITSLGGWVIKLGAKNSPSLPAMPRVVDYGHSAYKSGLMDIALIRGARLFIGTTSGLTNVAISFGIPAALVNCISTDAQLWHEQVRFIPKQVSLLSGTAVTLAELTRAPWRWRAFDAAVLARHGAVPTDNTSDEILETVKEVMANITGKADDYAAGVEGARDLHLRWQEGLSMPHYYGGARISVYYLKKHQRQLLPRTEKIEEAIPN